MARRRESLLTPEEIKKGTEELRRALVFFNSIDDMAAYFKIDRKSLYHYMKGVIPVPAHKALIIENLIEIRKQELSMIRISKENLRPDLFKKAG